MYDKTSNMKNFGTLLIIKREMKTAQVTRFKNQFQTQRNNNNMRNP